MMRASWLTLIVVFATIMLSFAGSVHAQENVPPVIDPSQVFTDVVEIVETHDVINIDKMGKTLYFRAAGMTTWQTIALPDDFPLGANTLRRSDGTYLIGSGYTEFVERQPRQTQESRQGPWLFDPRTGVLAKATDYVCGVVRSLPGEGRWILHAVADGSAYHFCNTETGLLSPALPERQAPLFCSSDYDTFGAYQAAVSPDGRYVVSVLCRQSPGGESTRAIYAYDLNTQTITFLGAVPGSTGEFLKWWLTVEQWADVTHAVIGLHKARPNYSLLTRLSREIVGNTLSNLWLADVSQPESMTLIVSADQLLDTDQLAIYNVQQRDYVWITKADCRIHRFSLDTRQASNSAPIPDVCGLGITVSNGSGDRLYAAPGVDGQPARLIRFNLTSLSYDALYAGEALSVISVSPDGRYAELTQGDFRNLLQQNSWTGYTGDVPEGYAHMVILDLLTREKIGMWPFYISDPVVAPTLAPALEWIDGSTFRLTGGTVYETSLNRIAAGALSSVRYPGNDNLNDPDWLFFIQQTQVVFQPDADHLLGLTDPDNHRIIPLMRSLPSLYPDKQKDNAYLADAYLVNAVQKDDRTLAITLIYVTINHKSMTVGDWLIRVVR